MTRHALTVAATLALAAVGTPAQAGELLTNGNFETGTFAGWSVNVRAGSPRFLANWFIDTPGTGTPNVNQTTASNPAGGNFYAITDAIGGAAYSLTQSFTVVAGASTLDLSFQLFTNHQGNREIIVGSQGLDASGAKNQHARVDLLRAGADPFSTNPNDVLANFYLGGNPAEGPNPYESYSFSLLPYVTAPGTYQVRFGAVANNGFFNLGIDNVSVNAGAAAMPEPATWTFLLIGFGFVGAGLRSASRRQRVKFA